MFAYAILWPGDLRHTVAGCCARGVLRSYEGKWEVEKANGNPRRERGEEPRRKAEPVVCAWRGEMLNILVLHKSGHSTEIKTYLDFHLYRYPPYAVKNLSWGPSSSLIWGKRPSDPALGMRGTCSAQYYGCALQVPCCGLLCQLWPRRITPVCIHVKRKNKAPISSLFVLVPIC